MQRDRVVDRAQGQVRRAVQIEVIAGMIEEIVELALLDLGVSEHEGQLAMHFTDGKHIATLLPGAAQLGSNSSVTSGLQLRLRL